MSSINSQHTIQWSRAYYIIVSTASYFILKLYLQSYNSSYYYTLSIFTPYNWKLFSPTSSLPLKKGSKFTPSISCPFQFNYYLQQKNSIPKDFSPFSTYLLILSTECFSTLKVLIVPSKSMTLLPIAISIVPRKIHIFYSIS